MKHTLSKSKIMSGLQCPKKLYYAVNNPELLPEMPQGAQMRFEQGNEVGQEARKRVPNGVLIEFAAHQDIALAKTQEAIDQGVLTIYEATLSHNDVLCKIDILTRESEKTSTFKTVRFKSMWPKGQALALKMFTSCTLTMSASIRI